MQPRRQPPSQPVSGQNTTTSSSAAAAAAAATTAAVHARTGSSGNTHSWIRLLRAAPAPTQAVAVRFNVVCMDMEKHEQRVFESIRCRLKEDLDSVDVLRRVAADVSADVKARASRLEEELCPVEEGDGDEDGEEHEEDCGPGDRRRQWDP